MLKTRRQRSFWARIKLSIILFQTPQRASDFNNFKQVPFLILGTLTLIEKTCIKQLYITSHTSFSFFVLRLFSLPKIFALWLFFFPFPLISKTSLLTARYFGAPQAKKNVSQNRLFCQASFFFFFFFSVLKLKPSQTLQTKKNIKALL